MIEDVKMMKCNYMPENITIMIFEDKKTSEIINIYVGSYKWLWRLYRNKWIFHYISFILTLGILNKSYSEKPL